MPKKSNELVYYEKYKNELISIKDLNRKILDAGQLTIDSSAKRKQDNLMFIEENIQKPLRYYQKEALFVFEELAYYTPDNIVYKRDLLESVQGKDIGFYTFEMATGSGKTLLMGATILDLYKQKGIRHFLIISPNTTLNDKTIKNFQVPQFSKKSVWANDTRLKINVITSEDYREETGMFYNENADINIYIFNIGKFFEVGGESSDDTMKGKPYVKRPIETTRWKDISGKTISFMEFLRQESLAIITDEAHHYQNIKVEGVQGNKSSFEVIKELEPEIVLEFTATAIENIANKRMQKIIYKYSIKDFIEDGFSKRIRAIGLKDELKSIELSEELSDFEKQKIILGMFVHLVKKKSLGDQVKPLLVIKCKSDQDYEDKVDAYIKKQLINDDKNISAVISKLSLENTTMTILIKELIGELNNDLQVIKKYLSPICTWSIKYDGITKNEKTTRALFEGLESNIVETVIYMKILDEGIDFNNIYTIIVMHDVKSNTKTSVRQIIGRGVRLYKNNREYDKSKDMLKNQTELLYIVCDKDKNFEEVINEIREEIGLSQNSISFDGVPELIENSVKADLLDNKQLPLVRVRAVRSTETSLVTEISKIKEIVNNYLNSKNGAVDLINETLVMRNLPESLISEGEIYSEKSFKKIEEKSGIRCLFDFDNKLSEDIYSRIIKSGKLPILPSNPQIINYFKQYIDEFRSRNIHFNYIEESDKISARSFFVTTFTFFYINHMNNRLFKYIYNVDNSVKLKDIFTKDYVSINKSDDNYTNLISIHEANLQYDTFNKDEIRTFFIDGYKNSIYKINHFDSNPEKYMADTLDKLLQNNGVEGDFWIRNQRNYYLQYKMNKYYPDFILYHKGKHYVIEVKGENLLEEFMDDSKKFGSLKKLNECDNVSCLVIKGQDAKTIREKCEVVNDLFYYSEL